MDVSGEPLYLVSACLLGMPTAYDGHGRLVAKLLALAAQGWVVTICPEVAGGLPIPRPPADSHPNRPLQVRVGELHDSLGLSRDGCQDHDRGRRRRAQAARR